MLSDYTRNNKKPVLKGFTMNMSLPLSDAEEAQLLSNLLCDPDDPLSARLLELHYQSTKGKILNEKTNDQRSTNEYSRSIRPN